MKLSTILSTAASVCMAMAQSYELNIFSEPDYLGQGATIEPSQCRTLLFLVSLLY